MSVVPPIPSKTSKFRRNVDEILSSAGRENLPILDPGVGHWVDRTTATWFKFLHDLSQAIPEILREGWVHEWPTYRMIPAHFKERWFLILARKYTWDPIHTPCVYTNFNLVARTIFREEMRVLKRIWASGGKKPDWMITRVWLDLCDMFNEFGPDTFGWPSYL